MIRNFLRVCVGTVLCLALSTHAVDLSPLYDQVYQIRVASPKAGSKSAIGSGFQVSADGLIATNYHVISGYVQSPDKNRIEYRSQDGGTGALRLLDFDVVNDLAILKRDDPATAYLQLAPSAKLPSA